MKMQEPIIRVGIMEKSQVLRGRFNGPFRVIDGPPLSGEFTARVENGRIILTGDSGGVIARSGESRCIHQEASTFTLCNVRIGIDFHWERGSEQTFAGDLVLYLAADGSMTAINEVPLEAYLVSVISSEMSAHAPGEFLKAHAIISRSWLVAMLERKSTANPSRRVAQKEGLLLRWYDREDHDAFDVCADDHCQRYQGIVPITEPAAAAVRTTRGTFLTHHEAICDARFHKACGGLTENFTSAWEDTVIPYLSSVSDAVGLFSPVRTEGEADAWINARPDAFCNLSDPGIFHQILPAFDQETTHFFRWSVTYSREQLEGILRQKSGLDFGTLHRLTPIERGPSGRIVRLKIEGSRQNLVVGKELEIRRLLSPTHLYSSAFMVSAEGDPSGAPTRFLFHGAGWGHGVGMCQIGAAVMATRGHGAEDILAHYYRGAALKKLY